MNAAAQTLAHIIVPPVQQPKEFILADIEKLFPQDADAPKQYVLH